MNQLTQLQIKEVVIGVNDPKICNKFLEMYSQEIDNFCMFMKEAFERWSEIDKLLTREKEEKKALTSALIYTALHSLRNR